MLGLAGAQFIRPAPNNGVAEGPQSLVAQRQVPADVQKMLQRACYDCHSDHTHYPWYASVQPVAWWLNQHVTEGKAELNFSAFGRYSPKRAASKLRDMADEVRERQMPLKSYLLVHGEAKLTDADIARLTSWAENLADEIEP